MTKKEIIKGNKLIAKFDGLEYLGKNVHGFSGYVFNLDKLNVEENCLCYCNSESMKYHSSWDWLMRVVEKIDFTEIDGRNVNVDISWCGTKIKHPLQCFDGEYSKANDSRIMRTWSVIVEFIKWYNKNNK